MSLTWQNAASLPQGHANPRANPRTKLLSWLDEALAASHAGATVPTAADIIAGLTLADAARYHLMAIESRLLTAMVERGVPFQRVADALGTTRQGAEHRYTRRLSDAVNLHSYTPRTPRPRRQPRLP